LDTIWQVLSDSMRSGCLGALGARIEPFAQGEALVLPAVLGLDEPVLLTTSRALYEQGPGKDDRRRMHFATYGDPVFERLVDHLVRWPEAPFDEVQQCWSERTPLAAVAVGGKRLGSVADAIAAGELDQQPLRLVARAALPVSGQSDQLGHRQRVLLEASAAHFAERKLKRAPDTARQQLAELDRFRGDVSRRNPPCVRFQCEVPDRHGILAAEPGLLWPVVDKANASASTPIHCCWTPSIRLIWRQLGEMKPDQRTASGVASALRERARSG
jgi:hypothetical protein